MYIEDLKQQFVQLSSLDVLCKSCTFARLCPAHVDVRKCVAVRERADAHYYATDLTIALLTLNGTYRAWRYPKEAVLIQSRIPVSSLHGPKPDDLRNDPESAGIGVC